jgi:hypothetical protein
MQPALGAAAPFLSLMAVLASQSPPQASIPLTVDLGAPPTIRFSWPLEPTATGYTVQRRIYGTSTWSSPIAVPGGGGATQWTDAGTLLALRYEYLFVRTGSPQGRVQVAAAHDGALLDQRGKVVLVVDATKAPALGGRLSRLVADLVGDGWTVARHDVLPTDSVPSVKARIVAEFNADPLGTRAVFLLGRVPVPYSGAIAPDGHPDHQGAWPADVYYGDVNGTWTDNVVNLTTATRPENRNVPGDGKFDQGTLPSDLELAVGRVDFANLPSFPASETQLLQQYLDKDHDYRHKAFAVDQRAVVDDNFGWFGGEAFAASGWRSFCALVGPANAVAGDYFATLNVPAGNGHAWSYGCGGGWYQGAGGVGSTADFVLSANRSVFTMLFGSYFGDWDSPDNFLRAALATGWTLTNVWAGRPHWSFHTMGVGDPIGFSARGSQNDTYNGGFGQRGVHMALLGDPTLRQHVIAPPSNLAVADQWPAAALSWTASPDAVVGYHVYRAGNPLGPFVRLTTAPVAATSYVDPLALAGPSHYLVRAVRRETAPTATYWHASQAAAASATLPTQPAAHVAYGSGCGGLQLTASPAPVSTATSGAQLTFVASNLPESAPGAGSYLGLVLFSFTPDPAGASLAALGMPGCSAWIGAAVHGVATTSNAPVQATGLALPAGLPPGTRLHAMAVGLTQAGVANAYGAVTSNGVTTFVNAF